MAKLLLACEEISTDSKNVGLARAAEGGHLDIVKSLLACKEVDPALESKSGTTPLMAAARNGH